VPHTRYVLWSKIEGEAKGSSIDLVDIGGHEDRVAPERPVIQGVTYIYQRGFPYTDGFTLDLAPGRDDLARSDELTYFVVSPQAPDVFLQVFRGARHPFIGSSACSPSISVEELVRLDSLSLVAMDLAGNLSPPSEPFRLPWRPPGLMRIWFGVWGSRAVLGLGLASVVGLVARMIHASWRKRGSKRLRP
jgi:hypothetical protein